MIPVKFCLLPLLLIASPVAGLWHNEKNAWHNEKKTFDSRQQVSQSASRRGSTIPSLAVSAEEEPQCESLFPQLFPGNQRANFAVHICQNDTKPLGLCYTSNHLKCCGVAFGGAVVLPESEVVTVGNQQVTVNFYRAGNLRAPVPRACIFFPHHSMIRACHLSHIYRSCDMVSRVCQQNTVQGSCTLNGCRCQPGYSPPDCCGCDFMTHFKATNGSCLRLCSSKCTIITVQRGCRRCRPGHTPPSCCECVHPDTNGECISHGGSQIAGNTNSVACRSDQVENGGMCVYPPRIQEFNRKY